MRIAIMLRAYDRSGGIGIYSRNIVRHLLEVDIDNQYLLLFNNKEHLNTFTAPNVAAQYIRPANQLKWDQIDALAAARKWDADLIFNTKFSVPILTKRRRIMVLHGASWYVHPELYGRFDIMYIRQAMPIYCRAADFLISNSDLTTRDFMRFVDVPESKIRTIHLAADSSFKRIDDGDELLAVRVRYDLPKRFLLTVTSYEPRKNFATLLKAFMPVHAATGAELVVIGKNCDRYAIDFDLAGMGISQFVHFPGWVEQADLPAIYSQAAAFVFPSIYEEFGIPILEAMGCGCPIVASKTGNIPDLIGHEDFLFDPFDATGMADGLMRVLSSPDISIDLGESGMRRAEKFSWQTAAEETIEVFRQVISN